MNKKETVSKEASFVEAASKKSNAIHSNPTSPLAFGEGTGVRSENLDAIHAIDANHEQRTTNIDQRKSANSFLIFNF